MRISDSGVFSSCETLAMKSLFRRDARRSATTDSSTMPMPTAMITVETSTNSGLMTFCHSMVVSALTFSSSLAASRRFQAYRFGSNDPS